MYAAKVKIYLDRLIWRIILSASNLGEPLLCDDRLGWGTAVIKSIESRCRLDSDAIIVVLGVASGANSAMIGSDHYCSCPEKSCK